MNAWIDENSMLLIIVLAALSAGLFLIGVVLLVLWRLARRSRSSERSERVDVERELIDLELSLAEQTGRLRIIRELHEVAVHDISVIISQADGARYGGEKDPTIAVRASATIAEAARGTIADLRRVMTLVRDGEAAVSVQPQLKSARDLFAVMRDAGLTVVFEEVGDRYDLKPGAELAVYRILQEALSNSLKYGGEGTEVRVTFTWTAEGFQVRIDDDGARNEVRMSGLDPNEVSRGKAYDLDEDVNALTGVVSGAGISEMRERTELFGGVFAATTVPGVGLSLTASFPSLRYHNGIHGVNLGA
ncbi:MAG: sensor histidine kinase [Microbacteriaceae bacterium]